MAFLIQTTANARRDISTAIEWEESRSPGLGDKFWEDLSERISTISETPYMGTIRYQNVRCTITQVFPYLIHYIVDDKAQTLIVLRVLHTNRKPIW